MPRAYRAGPPDARRDSRTRPIAAIAARRTAGAWRGRRVAYSTPMTLQRAALWAIVIAAAMYLLVAGRGLLLPAVLGVALWYMVDALADVIERPQLGQLKLPRPIALLAAICTM